MTVGFSDAIRFMVGKAQNWLCAKCLKPITSYHHKLPNTVYNQKRFPLFLSSPFNCVGLCQACHDKYPHLFRISTQKAEMYEEWLQQLKRGEI